MRTVGYGELPRTRPFLRKLLRELIDIDYENIPGLRAIDEGSIAQWVPVFEKSPEGYMLLVDRGKIKGYWNFVALTRGAFKRAEHGRLLESSITRREVRRLDRPGRYDMYFVSIVIAPELRDTEAIDMLDDAFYDTVERLARRGVYFADMCTDAYTRDGARRLRKLHLKDVARSMSNGEIYYTDFYSFLKRNAKSRKGLLKLYGDEFGP